MRREMDALRREYGSAWCQELWRRYPHLFQQPGEPRDAGIRHGETSAEYRAVQVYWQSGEFRRQVWQAPPRRPRPKRGGTP